MTNLYHCRIKLYYHPRSSEYLYVDTDGTPKTWRELKKTLDKALADNQRFDKSQPLAIEIVDTRISSELEEEQLI